MKILYLHGFASAPDYSNPKVVELSKLGEVYCPYICYENGYDEVIDYLENEVLESKADLIVGTSMGGLMAAILGTYYSVPFVSMNPVIDANKSLEKYIGMTKKYNGDSMKFTENELDSYVGVSFPTNCSVGTILLSKDDEVINYKETLDWYSANSNSLLRINIVTKGGHRFDDYEVMISAVKEVDSRSVGIGSLMRL